jgi:flavodoxin
MELHDNYVVVLMNQGIHLTPDKNQVLVDIANSHFKNKAFVYITHRIHSYSVDPSIYLQTSKIKNLAGFAVVAEAPLAKGNAEVEKLFFSTKPFEIFSTLKAAKEWAKTLLNNDKS